MVERAAKDEPGLLAWFDSHAGKPAHLAAPPALPAAPKLMPTAQPSKIAAKLSRTEAEIKAYLIRYCANSRHTHLADTYKYARLMIDTQRDWTDAQRADTVAWLEAHLGYTPAADLPAAAPLIPAHSYPIDPELARVAVALKLDNSLRLWAAMKAAEVNGRGVIAASSLPGILRQFDIEMDARTRRQAIANGAGIFYGIGKTGAIYLRKYEKVALELMRRAQQTAPDVVATNTPGRQPRYIVLAGNSADFRARVYAAWLDMKADRAQGISRFTLMALWQVSKPTLIAWEKSAGIQAARGQAQYAGNNPDLLPPQNDDGTDRRDYMTYTTVTGERRHSWRLSNHYRAPATPEKQTGRYTPRRVGAKCRNLQIEPSLIGMSGSDIGAAACGAGLRPPGRLYFAHSDAMESRKRVISHLKHFEDYQRAHYAQLAVKSLKHGDVVIYDVVDRAAPMTSAHELFTVRFPQQATGARRYA